jgi:hypothetical protein
MTEFSRLIEFTFPLKQATLDSVHEKNVRHGHISTLHIWQLSTRPATVKENRSYSIGLAVVMGSLELRGKSV